MKPSSGQRGQSAVEFALMLPVMVLIMLGVFDLGRAIWAYNVIANAAREGARIGIVQGTDTDAQSDTDIRDAVRGLTVGLDPISDAAIVINRGSATTGKTVTVRVNYRFDAATPVIDRFLVGGQIAVSSSATMVIE